MHGLQRPITENLSYEEIRDMLALFKKEDVYCFDEDSCIQKIIEITKGNARLIDILLKKLWNVIAQSKLSWAPYFIDEADIPVTLEEKSRFF